MQLSKERGGGGLTELQQGRKKRPQKVCCLLRTLGPFSRKMSEAPSPLVLIGAEEELNEVQLHRPANTLKKKEGAVQQSPPFVSFCKSSIK